jgi:hypothetical protein
MTKNHPMVPADRRSSCPLIACALALALPTFGGACGTREIDTTRFLLTTSTSTVGNTAPFAVSVVGDYNTIEEADAAASTGAADRAYSLRIDGLAAIQDDGPVVLWEGTALLWLPVGSHVFELVETNGHTAYRSETYDLTADHATHLITFGDRHALQAQIISYDLTIPAATLRYAVINLVRGQTIEAVRCADGDRSNCSPISSSLSFGQVLQAEAPLDPSGAGLTVGYAAPDLYYRVSPTASLPAPVPNRIVRDLIALEIFSGNTGEAPLFLGAPIFLGTMGEREESLDL